MRYTLVTFLACPACLGELALIVVKERPAAMSPRPIPPSTRVPPAGGVVAPLDPQLAWTEIGALLRKHAVGAAPAERHFTVEVDEGLLVCQTCARWFPVDGCLPELLPDHLRDRDRDSQFLEQSAHVLPTDLVNALKDGHTVAGPTVEDRGASHKRAEIGISAKVDDSSFFSPGYSSPFNQHNTEFTLYLIKLFGSAVPLLDLSHGHIALDSGCGYAWTTEWLYRAGVEPIGIDICRTYLEVGITRMGADRPHLVIADVENLPIRADCVDAILAFESAHHIPDRNKAMRGFGSVLKRGGRMVLAEPGASHEHAKVSVDVMHKYGILEKGMELSDVEEYVDGTQLGRPEQVFLIRASRRDLGRKLDRVFVQTHSAVEGNLFRVSRSETMLETIQSAWREPRRVVWPRVKRRLKTTLARIGLE